MRLRHFRDSIELPWISSDEMFDHSFQNNRNIKPVRILPGDQLILGNYLDHCLYQDAMSMSLLEDRR